MLKIDQVRFTVLQDIVHLLDDDDLEADSLTDDSRLTDIGLTSLLLARLTVQLEMVLGVDPFAQSLAISDVRTIGNLVAAYAGVPAPA
jgi:acyl carrier protein